MNEVTVKERINAIEGPQGISFSEGTFWVGSDKTSKLYAFDQSWKNVTQFDCPGEPFGSVRVNNNLRVVVGLGADVEDRYIFKFSAQSGFGARADAIACPDLTGSFLAYDGSTLWLSQLHNNKLMALDDAGHVMREIALERKPIGITVASGTFYVLLVDENSPERTLASIDTKQSNPSPQGIATLPFRARALACDGSQFWTTHRESDEVIGFTLP